MTSRAEAVSGIDEGIRYVCSELAAKRPAVHLGLGPSGFALLVGNFDRGLLQTPDGVIVAISLSRSNLQQLDRRVKELLELAPKGGEIWVPGMPGKG